MTPFVSLVPAGPYPTPSRGPTPAATYLVAEMDEISTELGPELAAMRHQRGLSMRGVAELTAAARSGQAIGDRMMSIDGAGRPPSAV
ncbi:hypothetical protein [Sphingomonas glacialis]|uniref:hypothetical protein n=1 Tax=Sphingomonas glacialis TaxID=658225 RepID=UPI00112C1CD3|nr:hypothetical protein [Sphingomonas glacialis]